MTGGREERYRLTTRAAEGIDSIWEYIAEDSVDRADRVIEDIFNAIHLLVDSAGIGHRRDDLADETLRAWPVHSYLIVYREKEPLEIVHVVSGYRDLFALFSSD